MHSQKSVTKKRGKITQRDENGVKYQVSFGGEWTKMVTLSKSDPVTSGDSVFEMMLKEIDSGHH